MKKFIIYNDNGEILRSGTCQDIDLSIQAKEGEHILLGECQDSENYKVINGELVYSPKQLSEAKILRYLRRHRNAILAQTDWTQMPDAPLTEAQKDRYKSYRQALRDLPKNYGTINTLSDISFPKIEDF